MLRKYDKNVCKCNSFLICLFFLLIYFFSPTLHFAKHESLQFGPDLNSLLQTTVWHNNMSEVRAVVLGRTRPSGYKNQKKVNSTLHLRTQAAQAQAQAQRILTHVLFQIDEIFLYSVPLHFPLRPCSISASRYSVAKSHFFLSLSLHFLIPKSQLKTHHTPSLSRCRSISLWVSGFGRCFRSCNDSNPLWVFHLWLSIGDSIAATDLRSLLRSQPPWRPPTLRSPWKRP